MIAWLKGTIVEVDGNEIVINTNNVGYTVTLGGNLLYKMGIKTGQLAEIVVYTSVREDEIKLFGFDSFFSRKVFSLLLGVNGVGPKVALNIIDQIDPPQVILSIKNSDYGPFVKVSGVGKKTAQRIILDLQGKLKNWDRLREFEDQTIKIENSDRAVFNKATLMDDARSALSNWGFSDKETDRVIRKHIKPDIRLEELIRKCLGDLRQTV